MCQPCHAHVSAAATAGNTVSPELQQIRLNLEWAWEQKTTERMGLLFAENAIMAQPDIPGLQFEGLAAIKHAYDQSFASDVRCTVKWVVQEGELAWLRYSIYEGHAAGVPMLGRAVLSGNVLNRMDVYNL